MENKETETKKFIKNNPIGRVMYLVELIHQMPSEALIELKDAVDMELKDREYLYKDNKKNWLENMFMRMRLGL